MNQKQLNKKILPGATNLEGEGRQGIRGESGTEKKIKKQRQGIFSILPLSLNSGPEIYRPFVEGLKLKKECYE
jgi:hypothetical protein